MSPLNPQYLTKKQTVFQKIADLVEKFKGVGGKVWYENSWKISLSTENFYTWWYTILKDRWIWFVWKCETIPTAIQIYLTILN